MREPLRVGLPVARVTRREGWVGETRPARQPRSRHPRFLALFKAEQQISRGRGSCSSRQMPSRQERRKTERDAAKALAKAGAAGAAGATAALANLNVNPLGDWTTQTEDHSVLFQALGPQVVIQMAAQGDRGAQYSQGCWLMVEANGFAVVAADRSPQADVGFALCTAQFQVAHKTETCRRGGHLS